MAVNLIKNGDFEATRVNNSSAGPNFDTKTGEGYIIDHTPQDWSRVFGSGVDLLNDVHSKFGTSKTPYGQYVELDGRMNTGIAQAVSTAPGKKYRLSFDWALPSYASNNYKFPDYSSKFDVVIDGKVTFSYDGTYGKRNAWTREDIFISASSSSTTIQFLEKGTSDAEGTLLDNISLVEAPVVRGNSLYTIVDGPSWTQAEANSVKLGGHLVTINDAKENKWLAENYASFGQRYNGTEKWLLNAWIGFTDSANEGEWKWSSGENSSFTGWGPGEPSDYALPAETPYELTDRTEDFAHIILPDVGGWRYDFGVYWNSAYNRAHMLHGGSTPEINGIAETPFIRRGDSAYVIVQGPTWEEAEANAVKLGGHLVTINDAAENEWLKNTFSSVGFGGHNNDAWIGLHRQNISDSFNWADGSSIGYSNWYPGEPNGSSQPGPYATNYGAVWLGEKSIGHSGPMFGFWNDYGNDLSSRGIAEIILAPNIAPTGSPTLSGTFKAGQVITINKTPVQDADNFTGYTPDFKYSWEIARDPGMTMMMPVWESLKTADATDGNETFTITADLTGKLIRGVVSYLDGYGTQESVASLGSSPIQPAINLDIGTTAITASQTTKLASTISRLTLTGIGNINATGNALNNYLTGNAGNNILDGGVGNDILAGGRGNDTYIVDSIYDSIVENINEGIEIIQSSVNWTLGTNLENLTLTGTGNLSGTGNGLNNTIIGNSGNNVLDGGSGIDTLDGGLGNDTLIGGLGNDVLRGGAGDDIYSVDSIGDIITEVSGTDTVMSAIAWTLGTNLENLTLTGTDAIRGIGNTLNNTIIGNDGNNVLDGLVGRDILTGGLRADTFRFSTKPTFGASTADHITDFSASEGDLLQISKSAFGLSSNATVSFATVSSATALTNALVSTSNFVYDSSNGNFYWNQNGNKSGFGTGGIFAVLDNKSALTSSNISLF